MNCLEFFPLRLVPSAVPPDHPPHSYSCQLFRTVTHTEPPRPPPKFTLPDLDLILQRADSLPPGIQIKKLQNGEYAYQAPGMAEPVRIPTHHDYFDDHSDSLELWSPGGPSFPAPEVAAIHAELPAFPSRRCSRHPAVKTLGGRVAAIGEATELETGRSFRECGSRFANLRSRPALRLRPKSGQHLTR